MSMLNWAKREVEIACKKENPDWDGESFDYGCECYQSALRAFESLCNDGHSGMSIGFTKNILNRLIDGKPLMPITDDDFFIGVKDKIAESEEYLNDKGLKSSIQCPRMSALFREEYLDGTVKYLDINRIICKDAQTGSTFHYGFADKFVEELFPITMPYMPKDKPYIVLTHQFLFNKEDKNNDWDTEAYYEIKTPEGESYSIEKYYKFENDERIEISEHEYLERLTQLVKEG